MFVWYNLHHIDENESWNLSFYFSFCCIVWCGRTLSGAKCIAFLVLHCRKWFSTTWVWMCFPQKLWKMLSLWKLKTAENVSQWKPFLSAILPFFFFFCCCCCCCWGLDGYHYVQLLMHLYIWAWQYFLLTHLLHMWQESVHIVQILVYFIMSRT